MPSDLPARIGLSLERDAHPFIQHRHARALDRRNVDENVFTAFIRRDEAKSLRRLKNLTVPD